MNPPLNFLVGTPITRNLVDSDLEDTPMTQTAVSSTIRDHLLDFGAKLKDDFDRKQQFATLIGATLHPTVTRWFKGSNEPVGTYELKVRIILECLGYQFPEHKRMVKAVHEFAQHVGLGLCSFEEAEKLLDIGRGQVLYLLSGRGGTSQEKQELLKLYVEEHAQTLADAIAKLPDLPKADKAPPPHESPPGPQEVRTEGGGIADESPPVLSDGAAPDKEFVKTLVVNLVKALGPVAKMLASDAFTPQDREEVRSQLGRFGVFDLKNDLIKLCGERARNTINEGS